MVGPPVTGLNIETFRSYDAAKRFENHLERSGYFPLLITGQPDRYDRVVHDVLWTGVK
jgi:hypothetical protein